MEVHTDILLQLLYLGDLDSRSGINFIQGHSGSDDCLDVVDLDTVILESSTDLIVVPGQLFLRYLVTACGIFLQQFQRRELVPRQLVPDIDRLQFLRDLG